MATKDNIRKEVREKEEVGKVSSSFGLHGLLQSLCLETRRPKVYALRDIATSVASMDTKRWIADRLRR
jgi:hypothetical protein